ncbi:MAG TPA: YnfA family protein [Blastocatellia bacterium]|nr:YnfA family protein [Blastocatellia bacterium]
MAIVKSLSYFVLTGLCEISGAYLIWLWLRESKRVWLVLPGAALLVLYGIIQTRQPAQFGRVYSAYGGVFICLSLLWAWRVDGFRPDKFDVFGAALALAGVLVIMYSPRK